MKFLLKTLMLTITLLTAANVYASNPVDNGEAAPSREYYIEQAKTLSANIADAEKNGNYDKIRHYMRELSQNPSLLNCFTPAQRALFQSHYGLNVR